MKSNVRFLSLGLAGASLAIGGLSGAGLARQEARTPGNPSRPIVVVVDAGHGASDSGAVGAGGVREKDVNLAIVQALSTTLAKSGITVRLTRDSDTAVPLGKRAAAVAEQKADYFLSIHSEAPGKNQASVREVVYYHQQDASGRKLATSIARQVGHTSSPAARVRSDSSVFPKGFAVLRQSPVPSVLVSLGDVSKFRTPQSRRGAAAAIAAGLRDFIAASK